LENKKKNLDNIVNNLLLRKKENPSALFEELHNIWREEIGEKNKFSCQCIQELNDKHCIDICLLGVQAIDNGFNCWDIFFMLQDAIPKINNNIDSIIQLFERFHKSTQGDLASGQQYLPVEQLTKEQPIFARQLLDKLLAGPAAFSVGYISTIFCSLSEQDKTNIHNELLSLIHNESVYVVQAAINALGRLDYQLSKDQKILEDSLQTLYELSKKNVQDIDIAIVQAFGNLAKISERAQEGLVVYAKQGNSHVHYQISEELFKNCKQFNQEQWFKDCMMELTRTSCLHKGIIHYLDRILYGIIQEAQDWNCVENFLTEWAIKSDINKNPNEEADSLFNLTVSLLSKNKEKLGKLITNLLNHDDYRAHNLITNLVHAPSVHDITGVELDKKVISSLDFDDILFISRKILGYIFWPDLLCSLIYSILKKKDIDDEVRGLVINIFTDLIGRDYPRKTINFLNERIKESNQNKIECKACKIIIKSIEKYQNQLKELPRLKELIPPNKQCYQIALEESKKMAETMEQAQKKSIVQQLATKIPLKYGRAWFSYRQGKYGKPTPLSSFSRSVEIPRSELIEPISAAMIRVGFRLAKRGDE